MPAAAVEMSAPESPAEVVENVARAADRRRRADLAHRLRAGIARAARPDTVVCVVGEFKQGKSSLVNALLEADVCPVDDDLATAVPTVIRHGSAVSVTVHGRSEGRRHATTIEPRELPDWVTEQGNPDNERGVEQVEVTLDHPLLGRGLVIIDTPGVGGLSAGHAVAAAAFLPYADALLFVSDASAELTAPEIDFLLEACSAGPEVILALTKVDLYPAWRRIAELDRGHLGAVDVSAEIVPASAHALAAALGRDDSELIDESGLPSLRSLLIDQVLDPGRDRAARMLLADCRSVLDFLETTNASEQEMIRDPAGITEATARYDALAERLREARETGARWQQVLNDGVTDMSSDVTFRFRSEIRRLSQEIDAEVEELRTPEQWDALAAALQRSVTDVVTGLFTDLDRRTDVLAERVRDLLHDDIGFATGSDDATGLGGLTERALTLPEQAGGLKRAGSGAFTAMRGAQSGLMLLGLLGRYLPMGAAAILFSNPVTLVLGAAFAGKQVHNVRRQGLTARRQQARSAARVFLDEFQLEASNRLAEVIRERSRALRDHFSARVAELQSTTQALAEQARQEAATLESDRARRMPALEAEAEELAELRSRVDELVRALQRRSTDATGDSTPTTAGRPEPSGGATP